MEKERMKRQRLMGRCSLCNTTLSKGVMTRHLKSCRQGKTLPEASPGKGKSQKARVFHLVVEGHHLPEYWTHLEAPTDTTLEDLDGFLRDIWLECCGHLSAFTIEGKTYTSGPSNEIDDEGMDVALGRVLSPGMRFYHEYDFGTTTELTLKVVSEGEGEARGIQLLARNEPPLIACISCGRVATQVCCGCIYSGEGWLCDECSGKHECGEDMLLPVVNSPRVGMCGYTGW